MHLGERMARDIIKSLFLSFIGHLDFSAPVVIFAICLESLGVLRYSRFRFPVFPRIKEVWNNQKYLVDACMSKADKTLHVQVFWFSVALNIILGLSCPKLQSPVKYINIRLVFLKMFSFLKFQMSRVVENVFLQAWNFIQVLLLPVLFLGPASWGLHFPEGSTVKVYRHTCRCRICKVVWGR